MQARCGVGGFARRRRLLVGLATCRLDADAWRMTEAGAGKTHLTSDSSGNCHPLGWR
jgi:hypothetical protein